MSCLNAADKLYLTSGARYPPTPRLPSLKRCAFSLSPTHTIMPPGNLERFVKIDVFS